MSLQWDEALLTMSKGEKAQLEIEPEWAYGKKGQPDAKYPSMSSGSSGNLGMLGQGGALWTGIQRGLHLFLLRQFRALLGVQLLFFF